MEFRTFFRLTLLIVLFIGIFNHGSITIGQGNDSNPFTLIEQLSDVSDFAVSPDENVIAIADSEGRIYLWDISSRNVLRELDLGGIVAPGSLEWSLDGRYLVAALGDGGHLWAVDSGQLIKVFDKHPLDIFDEAYRDNHSVSDITISPDSSIIATSQRNDKSVILWDVETLEIIHTLDKHEVGVEALTFSPNGKMLAAKATFLPEITLWDVTEGQRVKTLVGDQIAFSPDGAMIALGCCSEASYLSRIHILTVSTQQELRFFEAPLCLSELRWTLDSKSIIGNFTSGGLPNDNWEYVQGGIYVWDVFSGHQLHSFRLTSEQRLSYQLQDDEVLAAIGIGYSDGLILVLNTSENDVRTVQITGASTYLYEITSDRVLDFVLIPTQNQLLSSTSSGIVIWNAETNDVLYTVEEYGNQIKEIFWLSTREILIMLSSHDELLYIITYS